MTRRRCHCATGTPSRVAGSMRHLRFASASVDRSSDSMPELLKTLFPPLSNPAQFFLQTPAGAGISTTPTFHWTSSSGASRYWLQVDTSLAFAAPLVDLANLHWNQVLCPVTLSPSTTYYWRVTAVNWFGSTVSSPVSASFTTAP